MMKLSISLAQLSIRFGAVATNYDRARSMILSAHEQGSQLILFPELWTSGYDLKNAHVHAVENLTMLDLLAAEAAERQIYIGGSYLLEQQGDIYNTFVLIAPDGARWQYHKIHLFRLMDEQRWLKPGNQPAIAHLGAARAGLAICYDLRFPELFRQYAFDGVDCILLPAEWPAKRSNHWKILLRARAIENQVFMAAVNTVGVIDGVDFAGCSAIISPWGETIVEGTEHQEQVLTSVIDLDEIPQVRARIPILADRRPDIYG
jgi:predicted amidohydrolase